MNTPPLPHLNVEKCSNPGAKLKSLVFRYDGGVKISYRVLPKGKLEYLLLYFSLINAGYLPFKYNATSRMLESCFVPPPNDKIFGALALASAGPNLLLQVVARSVVLTECV